MKKITLARHLLVRLTALIAISTGILIGFASGAPPRSAHFSILPGWVRSGSPGPADAKFVVYHQTTTSITCSSWANQSTSCWTGIYDSTATFSVDQHSTSPCAGNYDVLPGRFFVRNGCRATFHIRHH